MCNLITHSLALLNVKKLSENSKFTAFNWLNISLDIMKKILTNFLDDSIDSRFLFDWLKRKIQLIERNSRSVEKLKKFIIKSQVDSINSWFLFDRLNGSFDQLKGILDWSKLLKLNFLEFSPNSFPQFFMNKLPSYEHNRLSLRSKTEFHWCYSLKIQSNILNIKLKQHHNINISFYQKIISITM